MQPAVRPEVNIRASRNLSGAEVRGQRTFPGEAEGFAVGRQIVRQAVLQPQQGETAQDLAADQFIPGRTALFIQQFRLRLQDLQPVCRQYGDHKLYKIACGPNGEDTNWTEVLMKNAAFCMDGLSMHNYTIPGSWEHKNRATEFTEADYWETLAIAADMERKIGLHSDIMDKYDPDKRIGLIIDEWGTWFEVEPGTNPGFLYQQNTMRDAMVAAIHLDLFNRHCDRVFMTNIAQTVNVLQALVLTKDEQMILTPTYHVYDLYQHHMDAKELHCEFEAGRLGDSGHTVPGITASASEKDGMITVTLSNLSPDRAEEVTISTGRPHGQVTGRILHGSMNAYNDFGNAPLHIEPFDGFTVGGGVLSVRMPACAVAEVRFSE